MKNLHLNPPEPRALFLVLALKKSRRLARYQQSNFWRIYIFEILNFSKIYFWEILGLIYSAWLEACKCWRWIIQWKVRTKQSLLGCWMFYSKKNNLPDIISRFAPPGGIPHRQQSFLWRPPVHNRSGSARHGEGSGAVESNRSHQHPFSLRPLILRKMIKNFQKVFSLLSVQNPPSEDLFEPIYI